MRRTFLNLIVDLAAAVMLLGMIATGYVIRFPLPPGTNKSHSLWGLTRHCWGSLHFWISVGLLSMLLVHVVLHWHWLVSIVAKRFGRTTPSEKRSVQIGLITVAVLAGASVLFVWSTQRSLQPITDAKPVGVCPPATAEEEVPLPTNGHSSRVVSPLISFSKDISTIFERSCLGCHGPERAAGSFRVDRKQDFFATTAGRPLIVPGKSSESPLIAIVSGKRTDIPRLERHRLPEADVAVLKAWIDAGAEWSLDERQ